jgi:hypothetical protein
MEKYYPPDDDSLYIAAYSVSTFCIVVPHVAVKVPRGLFDFNRSAIPTVNLNAIQIVVADASSHIAPKGQRQSIARLFTNHVFGSVWMV